MATTASGGKSLEGRMDSLALAKGKEEINPPNLQCSCADRVSRTKRELMKTSFQDIAKKRRDAGVCVYCGLGPEKQRSSSGWDDGWTPYQSERAKQKKYLMG